MIWERRLACSLLLAAAYPRWAHCTPPGYADPAACAACHQALAGSYAKTGMGRSFRSAKPDGSLKELESAWYDHPASREHFSSTRRGDAYFIRRTTTGISGRQADPFEARVDYAIGSGERVVSYLHRTRDNQLVEIPISWYGQDGGFWGMSPAYDRPDHPGFGRTITYRCLFCHNGYPDVPSGPGNFDGATVFPAKLPEGIDCQRCHGPAAAHVDAARQGKPAREIRAAIVNPARLSPERQMEVCMQCHLETTSAQLPGALMRFGRGVFSYRPGEPLSDSILYFDQAPGTGHDDKFEFVSSVYRLRKSACFNSSGGQLTCTRCHDPHIQPSRAEALRTTNRACEGCHETRIASLVKTGGHTAAADCATCHMPLRQGVDAIHVTITDHLIQRPAKTPPPALTVEEHDGNALPYAGEVVPYYPQAVDPIDAGIAQVNGLANLPAGLTRLEKVLAGAPSPNAVPYYELAAAYLRTAQAETAIPFYRQAVRLEPDNWRGLYGLAQALQAAGKVDQAIAALERAVSLAPYETSLVEGLGILYARAGRDQDAVRALREAVSRNPEDASAESNLGQALIQSNDLVNGEAAVREAARLRPESGLLRSNLAQVLIRHGQLSDAAFQLEEAIRIGPSSDLARSAWVVRLAAGGSLADARNSYQQSMGRQVSEARMNLGIVKQWLHDPDAAVREFRLAVDSDPQSAPATLNLGIALADHDQPEEARRWLEETLRLDPRQPVAHLRLGSLLWTAGLRPDAIPHLRQAAAADDAQIRAAALRLLESAK